jgi:hypothetical protein
MRDKQDAYFACPHDALKERALRLQKARVAERVVDQEIAAHIKRMEERNGLFGGQNATDNGH